MSSLTDIIFLLLIFFMLTSSLVAPNALNLKLPGKTKVPTVTNTKLDNVTISASGKYYLNGERVSLFELESKLRQKVRASSRQLKITISPNPKAPTETVVGVMDIALRYNIESVLAAEAG